MGVGRQESTVGKLDRTHQQPCFFSVPLQCVWFTVVTGQDSRKDLAEGELEVKAGGQYLD